MPDHKLTPGSADDIQVTALPGYTLELGNFNAAKTVVRLKQRPIVAPPPVPPPTPSGTVVSAGTGLAKAIADAPAGGTLILRGGDHVLPGGSGISLRKRLTLLRYEAEPARITFPVAAVPNGIYVESGGDLTVQDIAISNQPGAKPYGSSMGSALIEPRAGGKLTARRCAFGFAPGSVDGHQHMIYIADGTGPVLVEACAFDGGMNDGAGVHCYHDPGGSLEVGESVFRNFDYTAAIILDQSGTVARIDDNQFFDCRFAAIQFRQGTLHCHDNRGTRVKVGVQGKAPTTESGNVWA